jgi:hypothetical protein
MDLNQSDNLLLMTTCALHHTDLPADAPNRTAAQPTTT